MDSNNKDILPTYTKDSSWLKIYRHSNTLTACLTRLVTNYIMNIEWDYGYYQPWSDNEWLVNKMMALLNEDITMQ